MSEYPNLLAPLTIRGKTYKNRMLSAPTGFANFLAGPFRDGMLSMLEERARGGQASVCVGENPVSYPHPTSDTGGGKPGPTGRSLDIRDRSGAGFGMLRDVAGMIHRRGSLAIMELTHPGSTGTGNREYPNPLGPVAFTRDDGVGVKAYDRELMDKTCEEFADSALFMKEAGYDGVLLHGGHGFLMTQFFSPLTNKRADEYGGSDENRFRFPLEIIRSVRERVGEDFVIELRISGSERLPGGVTPEMMGAFSQRLPGLVDILHVSSGHYFSSYRTREFSSIYEPHGCNMDLAEMIRPYMPKDVYLGVVGGFNSPEYGEKLIRNGLIDFMIMGRQMFADPEFADKTASGHADGIRRCVRCMRCYAGSAEHRDELDWLKNNPPAIKPPSDADAFCTVNPATCGFLRPPYTCKPAERPLHVLVVGGGVAGMTAAITACDRGHKVTLAEKSGQLGGILHFTDRDAYKSDLRNFRELLARGVSKRDIRIALNTEVNGKYMASLRPDAVVIAVGAAPAAPPIPGLETAIPALSVYAQNDGLGKRIAMLGGGLVGCDTAVELATRGHKVTIVEMLPRIAMEVAFMQFTSVVDKLDELGVKRLVNTRCEKILHDGVEVTGEDGKTYTIPADSVVYSLGMKSNSDIVNSLKAHAPEGARVFVVGDCDRVARVGDAGRAGYLAACTI